jgi:integrase
MPKKPHSSGQARVTFNGKVFYLGPFGSPESHERYATLLRKMMGGEKVAERPPSAPQATLKLGQLLDKWLAYLDSTGRYRKGGVRTSSRMQAGHVVESLRAVAGSTPVAKCRKGTLVAWRNELERNVKLTRGGINRKVAVVLQAFDWGSDNDLVSEDTLASVTAIKSLKLGQVGDRPEHGRPRRDVTREEVELVAACASPQVAAMLRIQSLTGMRPGEALKLRWCNISNDQRHNAAGH